MLFILPIPELKAEIPNLWNATKFIQLNLKLVYSLSLIVRLPSL